MVYLDYSATTPVNEEVIETYAKVCREFIGNPNSLHTLGVKAKQLIDASTKQIAKILGVKETEIIYTSGASEANNTAVKGVCLQYASRGKHIITTELEHSSIIAPLSYLSHNGYEIDFVKLDENGLVDLEDLDRLIRKDTILVTIAAVNSEVGVRQDLKKIAEVVHKHPRVLFHSDVTQSIGKDKVDFSDLDLASLSCQKFYGMKGIGALIKKEKLMIEPLIHGGKSTTIFRSGTPATPLIASFAKALRLVYEDYDEKREKVQKLHDDLIESLKELDVTINSNNLCLPHIVNLSLHGIKSEVMLHALEEHEIYISTQTACSTGNYSKAVYAITHDKEKASNSIRISLSYLTTKEEIDFFLTTFKQCIEKLNFRRVS
ncbi:MAG: cysteine desulfurase [Bacilli bacterium]|nr:cysteine desulfurase [Bacilli bacterium]